MEKKKKDGKALFIIHQSVDNSIFEKIARVIIAKKGLGYVGKML